jgi:hypothetical protein
MGIVEPELSDPAYEPSPARAGLQWSMHAVASGAPQRTLDLRLPDSQSLHVQDPRQPDTSSESDEENAATVVATRLLLDQRVDTQPSLAGVGSLYWAVRHPR